MLLKKILITERRKEDGIRCELMMQGEREMAEKGKVGHVGHMKSYLI